MGSKHSEILGILEEKCAESTRFIKKYQDREMTDLEEYYKGAEMALKWSIKKISELEDSSD